MRKTRLLAVVLAALGVSSLAIAQSVPATPASTAHAIARIRLDRLPPAVIPFNDGWLYHQGDNLAWADPASNDAGWQSVTLDKQSLNQRNAWHWYRIRINQPAGHPPLALLLVAQDSGGFETYINGRRAGDSGFQSFWNSSHAVDVIPLPDSVGPILVAIRVHYPDAFSWDWNTGITAFFGSDKAVRERLAFLHSQALVDTLPSAGINLALILAGIAVLLLFRAQPASREYFWLGLYLLLVGTSFGLFTVINTTGLVPRRINSFYCDPIVFVFAVAQIEFTFAFVHRGVNRFWRIYECLLLACLICTVLFLANILSYSVYFLIESLAVIPPAAALPFVLFYWYRRGNPEAGWLIVPSLFPAFGVAITNLAPITGFHLNFPALPVPFRLWGQAPVYIYDLADGIFLLAIGVVIFVRFTRVSRQQARAAAEFEAARAVQQVLVPVENPAIPGFRIDGLYLPAGEVGGDFYQVVPTASGGVLAVVGDVSGKGMPAAMTVSLLIGTFRTLAHYTQSPAEILNAMNQRMIARLHGGFTTCLVLRVDCDGTLTAANAGHIPPYMDGREQTLEYGLPLGLEEDAGYTETTLVLRPGAQLTLLTDGVIEARSTSRELFGFDRTATVSTQPAEAIAHAAQQFGQEDDITVLTLQFAPA